MPVRNFNDRTSVYKTLCVLRQRHERWMATIAPVTVMKMLRVCQEMLKGANTGELRLSHNWSPCIRINLI